MLGKEVIGLYLSLIIIVGTAVSAIQEQQRKKKLFVTEICKGKSMFLREFREKLDEMGGLDYA